MIARLCAIFRAAPVQSARIALPTQPVWQDLRFVVLIFVFSRLAFYSVALCALAFIPRAPAWPGQIELTPYPVLALHWRWDAIHYYSLALGGYGAAPGTVPTDQPQGLAAFLPLFPLLIRTLASLLGQPADVTLALSGIVIIQLGTLLAFWLLYELVREETGDRPTAQRTLLYTAIFPLAFYYAVAYAEVLYLATSLGTFLAARRGRWVRAGFWAAAAATARPFGVLLLPVLVLEAVLAWRRGALSAAAVPRVLVGLSIAPLGLALFMLHLWQRVGDPLAFVHAQAEFWQREPIFPLTMLWRALGFVLHPALSDNVDSYARTVLHTLIVFGGLLVLIASLHTWRPTFMLYGVLLFIHVLSVPWPGTILMHSLGRSIMICFPLYISLARWGQRPGFHHAIVVMWLPLYGILAALYVCWYFVA